MIDHQIDEEMIFRDEVSDEAVEAAAGIALGGLPTMMYHTYCFTCPSDPLRSYSASTSLDGFAMGPSALENNHLRRSVAVRPHKPHNLL
jgi:hypothetical protein